MPARIITKSDRVKRIFKSAMYAKGFTQEKLAKKLGVKQSTVSVWISDYRDMSVKNFELICKILGINASEILLTDERT